MGLIGVAGASTAHAAPLADDGWTTDVTTPATVARGEAVELTVSVTAATTSAALVDIEVYSLNADGRGWHQALQQVWDAQTFTAGQATTLRTQWTVPADEPTNVHWVKVGVFKPGWGVLYHWNDAATSFLVASASTPTTTVTPTTTAPTTTTKPPATTAAPTTTAAPATTAAPTTTKPPATTAAPTTTGGPTTTMPAGMHMPCPGIPDTTPIGAVPPALPMLCDHMTTGVPATFVNGANSWLDDFQHGASMTQMGAGYKRFEVSSLDADGRTDTFRHNNHWMVDVFAPGGGVGGSMLRPDRSFRFENGRLVIETDVAGDIVEYEGFAWPEVTVTTASSPDGQPYGSTPARSTGDDLYAYGRFGGYDAVGVRLTGARPIMAYYDTSERGFPCGRVWELSWFQDGSGQCTDDKDATIWGGGEWAAPGAVRTCRGDDPDIVCRDRFRWELTRDTITLYANGRKLMEHTAVAGKHLIPDAILNGPVYVYFSDSVYQPPSDKVVRFHWDRVAVNPSTGLTASPTCTPDAPCG